MENQFSVNGFHFNIWSRRSGTRSIFGTRASQQKDQILLDCPDTKINLAKPLYDSLQQTGIQAYLDQLETELGDYFHCAIKNAIFSATVHIAILSPQYAESAWCLAELALMFQTKARIIPLFYHVEPSDFRYIKNGVADAFSKHEEKGRYPRHDIQQWKECLQNVSGIMGYELNGHNDDLNKLYDDIMSAVVKEKQKRKIPLQVAKYEVGLDEVVKDFHNHCQRNGEMRDKIIGIFGMGGSGKTTLSKYLFNSKHSEFSKSTILFDVRENHVKGKLNSLQRKLLSDLEGPKNQDEFCSIEEGIACIKVCLEKSRESKFLIVIDDVDQQKQLDALLPTDALNPNSLVIVTTRDERLLIQAGVRVCYKMKVMNPQHSRELFCWHAFHRQSYKSGFDNLVDSFVDVCGGLPLALQVMGGHVFGSDKVYWKLQLDVVKERPHKDIKDTLKISYDSLEEDQKQIFMDIACFFIGESVSKSMSIWKASGWRAEHAIQTLKDKCLVEVQTCFDGVHTFHKRCHYEPGFVWRMHDHLRDLGRDMADYETSHPRRLWRPEDRIVDMRQIERFQDTLAGSEGNSVRCYSVTADTRSRWLERKYHLADIESEVYAGYFMEISKTSTYVKWLSLGSTYGGDKWIPEYIPLQNLHSLEIFGLSPARLWQRDDQVLVKLKELSCSFDIVCTTDVNDDMLNELVSSFGKFKNLESLHLVFQNFICFSSKLNIEWNWLLKSVRELTNLKALKLEGFEVEGEIALSNTGETTDDRFRMRSLEALSLCDVRNTRKISISRQFCPTLKSLKLCSMIHLTEVNLTGVTTLESLVLLKCIQLKRVLSNYMPELEMFRIKRCPAMKELPNFGRVSCLQRIYITHCQKLQDISAIERLKGLKRIWIAYCPELKSIKAIEQLKGLKRIWIQECTQLQGIICLKELKELKRIFIGQCDRLQDIQGIEYLNRLESIIITECPELQNIRGIEELRGLKEMIIAVGPILSYVQRLQRLPSELTMLMGRAAVTCPDKWKELMSDLDKIAYVLPVETGFYCFLNIEKKVKEMMDLFHKKQRSLSKLIFCAMVHGSNQYICIGTDICIGTRIKLNRSIGLSPPGHFESKIYTCVVNEGWLSKRESWLLPQCHISKLLIMGVEAGEERETLRILETIYAQQRPSDPVYEEYNTLIGDHGMREGVKVDYEDLAEYVDDDEKYDGGDDD
ncbi:hypothetical protein SUGI_0802100 [Cryptomeria japonica]|uniref:disease resistance protein Roq1-like isoform X2 n=1 Tax=Cryptomeria japonica TaxID=3369 RepID=UPI0024149032|nr:disease resistance protein Roq1-like isoform X2 [Cryptomeria japonica]GLJ39304.1 hypothetical protein SUGI_0802100 [Cryptomeria japonica]